MTSYFIEKTDPTSGNFLIFLPPRQQNYPYLHTSSLPSDGESVPSLLSIDNLSSFFLISSPVFSRTKRTKPRFVSPLRSWIFSVALITSFEVYCTCFSISWLEATGEIFLNLFLKMHLLGTRGGNCGRQLQIFTQMSPSRSVFNL